MVAWYDRLPSSAQLRYLRNLGYDGPAPAAMAEASAAIDEMLASGDSNAAHQQIVAERRERVSLFGTERSGSVSRGGPSALWIFALPFIVFGYLAAGCFWCVSRLIASIGWTLYGVAALLVWVLSRVGLVARRSASVAVQAGREQVIPWIGAQDWRSMAAGCRVQLAAAVRSVDCVLAWASGDDRFLHHILRFATAAAVSIGISAIVLFLL